MQYKCLAPQVVYEAEVTNSAKEELKICYGLTETTFTERHRDLETKFNKRYHMKDTELSKYIWSLKDQNKIVPYEMEYC